MLKPLTIAGFLCFTSSFAHAAEVPASDCAQLRDQIRAQTGILSRPDTALLQKLGARPECRFSAAEVYRAAYGDKPLPRTETRSHRRHGHDDD